MCPYNEYPIIDSIHKSAILPRNHIDTIYLQQQTLKKYYN